jgi:ketosteroid isomerase-like protein
VFRQAIPLIVLLICSEAAISQTATNVSSKSFRAFLERLDAAQLELHNGRAEAFKSLWSHADDTTLSGGFGGSTEKGWDAISKRLDWVGQQFSNGTNTINRIVSNSDGDLAYVVQLEHIRFTVPESKTEATRHYRVTMIFRREKDGWRIVHRQADSLMANQAQK